MKPGAKRRVNVVVGVACDGGFMELNTDAVPGIDAVPAVARYAGARILIGLDKGVVVGGNPMPAVGRDGNVVKMGGTVISDLDAVSAVICDAARGKPKCGVCGSSDTLAGVVRNGGSLKTDVAAGPDTDTLIARLCTKLVKSMCVTGRLHQAV